MLPKIISDEEVSRTIPDQCMAWATLPEPVDGQIACAVVMPVNSCGKFNGLEALMYACALRANDPEWVNEMHDWLRETGVMADDNGKPN